MQIVRRPLAPGEADHELIWLAVSLGGLALASTWFALQLPWPVCLFHSITGHPCLTCGATRCAIAFFHGQFFTAWKWNPLAFCAYSTLSIFDVYACAVLMWGARRVRLVSVTSEEKDFARVSFVTLLLVNWTYLLVAGN